MSPNPQNQLVIGLNAVIAAVDVDAPSGAPQVLCTRSDTSEHALPYGAFDPERHRTFDIGLRDFVTRQTNMCLGFVEQLYTFGDQGRERPAAVLAGGAPETRIISVGYLALTPTPAPISHSGTSWKSWYDFFPWEDWRGGEPNILSQFILPAMWRWVAADAAEEETRATRLRLAFGFDGLGWEEERVLDRYELMYEAGLVAEAFRGHPPQNRVEPKGFVQTGILMASDHRRIIATAISRLRGKLRYRPVIFEMMPKTFTLLQLQHAVEAILGFSLHKQNFRRGVENSGLAINTGKMSEGTGGRPAALFTRGEDIQADTMPRDKTIQGLTLPRLRAKPGGSG